MIIFFSLYLLLTHKFIIELILRYADIIEKIIFRLQGVALLLDAASLLCFKIKFRALFIEADPSTIFL